MGDSIPRMVPAGESTVPARAVQAPPPTPPGSACRHVPQADRLRAARVARNWTLRRLIEEVDRHARRTTGLTESLVSSWERGRVRPSMAYRQLLCQVYDATSEALGFTDLGERSAASRLGLLTSYRQLLEAMCRVVDEARTFLVATGSRTREASYLEAIERNLTRRPELVVYRVLFGPPQHRLLTDHMLRLLRLRNPDDQPGGADRLYLGVIDASVEPERGICASEREAVLVIPSLVQAGNFDTGIVFGEGDAMRLVDHVRQLYTSSRRLETTACVESLVIGG
jgi:transcriptional regulator with XRE-family HTH domain